MTLGVFLCWPSVCLLKNVYLDPLLILKSSCLVFCCCLRNFFLRLIISGNSLCLRGLKQNFSLKFSPRINTDWSKKIFFSFRTTTLFLLYHFFFSALFWIYPSNSYVDGYLHKGVSTLFHVWRETKFLLNTVLNIIELMNCQILKLYHKTDFGRCIKELWIH